MAGRVFDVVSASNPRVKALVDLRKRRARDERRAVAVEGLHEIRLARAAGASIHELYVCLDLVQDPTRLALVDELTEGGVDVIRLSRQAFTKAAYRESPDGWLAVVADPSRTLDSIELPASPLVLVCQGVEKPGNLGAMLRTADAAGVAAVVAADAGTDWGNPNVVRASKGTVFAVPVASGATSEVVAWLRLHGLRIVVATPEARDELSGVDLTGPTAVVVGAEHAGVTDAWLGEAERTMRIPMTGQVNSLNVAVSAAVVLYEAVRQRG